MSDILSLLKEALANTPRPAASLLNVSSETRKEYERDVDRRVSLRTKIMFLELGIKSDEYELACRLASDDALCKRIFELMQRSDLSKFGEQLRIIHNEEFAASEHYFNLCDDCHSAEVRLTRRYRRLCESCFLKAADGPSCPPRCGIASALARARAAGLAATLTDEEWEVTVAHFNDRCAYCRGPWCLVEHATPLEHGGPTTAVNCLPACASCNMSKGDRSIESLLLSNERRGFFDVEIVGVAVDWLRQCGRSVTSPQES